MVGALTEVLAHRARHSLAVAGFALAVAATAAFLPVGLGAASSDTQSPILASNPDPAADSVSALRNVFTTSAASSAGATQPPSEAPLTPASTPVPASPTPVPTEVAGETTVSSALQQATQQRTSIPTSPAPTQQYAPASETPTEVAKVYSSSLPSVQAALAESPWPVELWPTVERIVQCESSGNPAAVGPGGYVGLMQVDPRLHGAVPADPVAQLAQAYDVYLREGWGAWGCY